MSFACFLTNLTVIGVTEVSTVQFGVPKGTCVASSRSRVLLAVSTKRIIVSVLPGVSIAKSDNAPLSGVVSAHCWVN